MDRQGTSLILGGTGMLAAASCWLIEQSEVAVVVGRHASAFSAGQDDLRGIDADWGAPDFIARVQAVLAGVPAVRRALLWLHEPAALLPRLLPLCPEARITLVLGSRHDSEVALGRRHIAVVRLGSKPTPDGRRWLTHAEISEAAIAALSDGRSRVVGEWMPDN